MQELEKKIDEKFERVFKKLDSIIDRNAKADTSLALLDQKIKNHVDSDMSTFKAIEKKHSWYDKLIYTALIGSVAELMYLVFQK